jgi:hypothetical protein
MAENEFSLHVDTDWKKQAQEEKRKLAEEQAKKAAAATAPAPATSPGPMAMAPNDPRGGPVPSRGKRERELPPASFGTLVNSMVTQILYYLGGLGEGESPVNLDMARYQLDTLGVLEDKTKGNLSDDERRLLDGALYETRNRFVGVASQYINF